MRRDAEIDTNRRDRLQHRTDTVGLDHQADIAAATIEQDRGPLQWSGEPHRLAHPYPADDRQFDTLAVSPEGAGRISGAERRAVFFAFEPWIAAALFENAWKAVPRSMT